MGKCIPATPAGVTVTFLGLAAPRWRELSYDALHGLPSSRLPGTIIDADEETIDAIEGSVGKSELQMILTQGARLPRGNVSLERRAYESTALPLSEKYNDQALMTFFPHDGDTLAGVSGRVFLSLGEPGEMLMGDWDPRFELAREGRKWSVAALAGATGAAARWFAEHRRGGAAVITRVALDGWRIERFLGSDVLLRLRVHDRDEHERIWAAVDQDAMLENLLSSKSDWMRKEVARGDGGDSDGDDIPNGDEDEEGAKSRSDHGVQPSSSSDGGEKLPRQNRGRKVVRGAGGHDSDDDDLPDPDDVDEKSV